MTEQGTRTGAGGRLVLCELGRVTIATPNGCDVCGWPERGHGEWFVAPHLPPAEQATYVPPSDETRLARMKLRRYLRQMRQASVVDWPAAKRSTDADIE